MAQLAGQAFYEHGLPDASHDAHELQHAATLMEDRIVSQLERQSIHSNASASSEVPSAGAKAHLLALSKGEAAAIRIRAAQRQKIRHRNVGGGSVSGDAVRAEKLAEITTGGIEARRKRAYERSKARLMMAHSPIDVQEMGPE